MRLLKFLLPISTTQIDVHEVPKGGSAQRRTAQEKTNCGNQVAEIQGEREKNGIKKGL